jgi:large subunit ribosomal protein L22
MIENLSVTTKFLRISPTKVNRIAQKLKGKSYREALSFLEKIPQKTSVKIWQTLKSVGSNASHNYSLSKENLSISEIYVNQGSILKRIHARARGKAYRIEKKFSHLTISLAYAN